MANEWPLQQVGSTGEDVRTVQLLLAAHGHPVAVDGVFGPLTQAAVVEVQTEAGIVADGIVGPQTWAVLLVTVSAGTADRRCRPRRVSCGPRVGAWPSTGASGPRPIVPVRDFQVARGLVVDGIVGPQTWQTLVADFMRLGSPEEASTHLYDAWGASDRPLALTNATQSAVDRCCGAPGVISSRSAAPRTPSSVPGRSCAHSGSKAAP